MEIEITGMRKKLLSCTNSSVVYTWKVVNKVVVETGFPCVPIISKSEGGEWGGGGKGAYLRGELVWHYDPVSGSIWGVVLFTTWALICQAFSRAWSMSINSQSLVFSRKIDNRIRHLGWACEHNLNPSPPGGFKQPILKSSNAHGLPRGDVESSNWPTHKILTVEVWHSHERAYGLWAISIDNEIFSAYELPSV